MTYKIYSITHLESGREYIGATMRTVERRFHEQWSKGHQNQNPDSIEYQLASLGKEKFILEQLSEAESVNEAKKMVANLSIERNTIFPHGFNQRLFGEKGGIYLSPERRQIINEKIRNAQLEFNRQKKLIN